MMITMGLAPSLASSMFDVTLTTPATAAPAGPSEDRDEAATPAGSSDGAFARLANLVRSNDRLMADLKALDARLADAKAYLARPDANVALGRAQLERVRASRSRVLAILRANRLAAREFLAI